MGRYFMFNNNDYHAMQTSQSRSLMQRVYGWMALALSISATLAYVVATTPALKNMLYNNFLVMIVLFVAQIGLVVYLSARLAQMSTSAAVITFLSYAALSGITLSSLFLVYTLPSLGITLLVTATMFLAMALYGYFTKSDLSSLGDFLFMGMIGLMLANVIGWFFGGPDFSLVTSAFGVVIFTLFTAYDVQQIKQMGNQMLLNHNDLFKVSLLGALKLYLDFVNLFLYLLRFFGQQRRD